MTTQDPRLEEIEGRANVIRRCMEAHPNDSYDMGDIGPALEAAKGDVPYLLAELRKAQDKLARVEGVVDRVAWEADNSRAAESNAAEVNDGARLMACQSETFAYRLAAQLLRAAVADATGGERG